MKVNLGKLARLAWRIVVAAPAVVEAVKPIVKASGSRPAETKDDAIDDGRPALLT